jgi:hypothetical protein
MASMPRRERIGLEIEVDAESVVVEPTEWDLEELLSAVGEGVARLHRVVRGRVIDEERDPLSATLDGLAEDLLRDLDLHWMGSASPAGALQPAPGAPRPSLETLVELRELAEHTRRVADRLRAEGM